MPAVTDTVISGPYLLAALLSLAAGAVSFASPCVIPLVPGYLAYLASLVGAEAAVVPAGQAPGAARPAPVGHLNPIQNGKCMVSRGFGPTVGNKAAAHLAINPEIPGR